MPLILTLSAAFVLISVQLVANLRLWRSDVYQQAVQAAAENPQVQQAIGSGIHTTLPGLGQLFTIGASEFAEWSVSLKGSRGSGRLYAVANQTAGMWEFSRLVFRSDNGKELEITPVHRSALPAVPEKRVYVIPVGLQSDEHLDWVPAFYKAKLGIQVGLLPAIPLPPELIDSNRHQLDAEKCVAFLQGKFRDLAADPSVILIGVTSKDMYIAGVDWRYAISYRNTGRFAIVSSARLRPGAWFARMNPAWLSSRVEKLLTKDLAILYFDLPMSSDYSSMVSGGILSPEEVDEMGGQVVGAEKNWDSFVNSGEPAVTVYELPGRAPLWRLSNLYDRKPPAGAQVFSSLLESGLFVQRKTDFSFDDDSEMQFSRVSCNHDGRSRAFGIGGSHSFDVFLVGQMGVAFDLIRDDGSRVHFVKQPAPAGQPSEYYRAVRHAEDHFAGAQAVYVGDTWQIKTYDGWTYFFPYRPKALGQYVTVLTSFTDPSGRHYEMTRDSDGVLLEVRSEVGNWLRFDNDMEHRITKITASTGRFVQYEYDQAGYLIRATDSDGRVNTYAYDAKGNMLSAADDDRTILTNTFDSDGYMVGQTVGQKDNFEYSYYREGNMLLQTQVTEPNSLQTYFQYGQQGYIQSLPAAKP